MKKKAVVFCLLGAMALGTCTVSAANGTKNISATFRNIKIVVDGKEVSTSAEPFIYNGTTYLPIRAVGEAVGKEVTWNAGTNTVYLGEVPESAKQPETPAAPAATGSLPIFKKFVVEFEGYSEAEVSEVLAAVRSGEESAYLIAEMYLKCIDEAIYADNPQLARAAYAEAQTALASITSAPDYAEAKEEFERIYHEDFLPRL